MTFPFEGHVVLQSGVRIQTEWHPDLNTVDLGYARVMVGYVTISVVDTCALRSRSRVLLSNLSSVLLFPYQCLQEAPMQHKQSQCRKRCDIRESAQGNMQHGSV